jgi:hypothetical protein
VHPKSTAQADRITTVFDNSAGVKSHKPKFMNILQPSAALYKTFCIFARRGPDLKLLL